jgi:hypothetical protein
VEKFCQHIEKLLAQYDYVVVPNLGGFVVQMQSAQLLPDRITPPLATIAFNPLMHHADGLLAIEIARSEKISYRKAVEYIEKELENIKSKLDSTGTIPFGNLGVINQDETGNLIFTPYPKADFLPQNFQLSDLFVSTKELRSVENKKKITITMPSGSIFKYAAAAMIVFGLFAIAPKVSDTQHTNNAGLVTISFETNQKVSLPAKAITKKPEVETGDTTETIETVKTIDKKDTVTITNFHVIVASLATQESAERLCKELASNEFPNAQVLPPAKTYRVAIQSFSNRDEAIQYMEKLRKTDSRFESAWVLCK